MFLLRIKDMFMKLHQIADIAAWSIGALLLVGALCWAVVNAIVMWVTRD